MRAMSDSRRRWRIVDVVKGTLDPATERLIGQPIAGHEVVGGLANGTSSATAPGPTTAN
jgi:hypothetical protein